MRVISDGYTKGSGKPVSDAGFLQEEKQPKSAVLNGKVPSRLVDRVERLADHDDIDQSTKSEIVHDVVAVWVEEREAELDLPPIKLQQGGRR